MYEHASERPSNRAAYPNHEFPLAPEAVRAAYAQYWQSIQEPAHSLAARQSAMATTNTLIADFCVDYLTPQTYHAAMLSEQADGLRDPRYKEHALRSLNTYRTASHEPHEDQHFIFGLLSDREVIDDFWRENATQTYANDSTRLALYMDQNNSLAVPREVWRQRALGMRDNSFQDRVDQCYIEIGTRDNLPLIEASPSVEDIQQKIRELLYIRGLLTPISDR